VFHTHFAGPAGVLPIAILGVLAYASALGRVRSLIYAAARGLRRCAGFLQIHALPQP